MKRCCFCGKAQATDRALAVSKVKRSAKICRDCLKVCRDVLDGAAMRRRSGVYRCAAPERVPQFHRCCSFRGWHMKVAGKLISSPLDREACCICPRCVGDNEDLLAKPAPEPLWSRLVRLLRRSAGSKLMDLSGLTSSLHRKN